MKMQQALAKVKQLSDEELLELDKIFKDYVLNRKTLKQIADESGYSIATISNRVSLARAALLVHLQNNAELYIADVFSGYWQIYNKASQEFENTGDVKFLTESRKALGDLVLLLGLRAAPKAAVSDDPLKKPDSDQDFVFVLDEAQYKEAENKLKEIGEPVIIEGDIITNED